MVVFWAKQRTKHDSKYGFYGLHIVFIQIYIYIAMTCGT